jgi:hypothetical protein
VKDEQRPDQTSLGKASVGASGAPAIVAVPLARKGVALHVADAVVLVGRVAVDRAAGAAALDQAVAVVILALGGVAGELEGGGKRERRRVRAMGSG